MCRHEFATYACGHKEDLGFLCDYAQYHGPLFNKAACPNYSHGAERVDVFTQCGGQDGFYCAKSQDGVVIDKTREAMTTAHAQFNIKKTEFQSIALRCTNYLQEAKMRGVSNEELVKVSHYRDIEQQRQLLGRQCTVLRNRAIYFNSLINFAFRNRHLLAPGVCHHPEWDRISFDFANTIFPLDMLQPIRRLLPGHVPPSMPPAGQNLQNPTNQDHSQQQMIGNQTYTDPGSAAPAPQVKSTRRPKLKVTTTPTKQTTVTEEGSPMSSDIIRGNTPEGEDMMTKAARYRAQLSITRRKVVFDALEEAGYDVQTHGIRPPGKQGYRHTPTKNRSPVAGDKSSFSTPAKVRRSARTRNSKPKYVEGSDNSLGSDAASPYKADQIWNGSPGKSDAAWADTPTKSEASSSPLRPARGRNNRTTQRMTASPNSGPTQTLLSSRISDFRKRTVNAASSRPLQVAPTQFGNLFKPSTDALQTQRTDSAHGLPFDDNTPDQNMHAAYGPGPITSYSNQASTSMGSAQDRVQVQGWPQSSHTPQQRTAAMQRGSHLIQEFGQSLYQHHLALGMVDTAAGDVVPSTRSQQYAASPGAAFAPQAQILGTMSHVSSSQFNDPLSGESPASPMNFFHRNLNQARAGASQRHQSFSASVQTPNITSDLPQTTACTVADVFSAESQSLPKSSTASHDVSQGHSFSTGSLPFPSPQEQFGGSPVSPLSHGFHQPTPVRVDYENMRRSFSSNVDLTPQHSLLSQHSTANAVPLKRSLPPASPTIGRKRQRLSLPGEDDAPTLTPSASKHQLYAPAGLPADDHIDYAAQIAAIEEFEKQNMAGFEAHSAANTNLDQGLYAEHTTGNTEAMPSNVNHNVNQGIPINPKLYQTTDTDPAAQPTEDNLSGSPGQVAGNPDPQTPQAAATSTQGQGLLDDSSSPLSEPDWSLLNDEAYDAYLQT